MTRGTKVWQVVQLSSTVSRPGPGGKISSIFNLVELLDCAPALVGVAAGATGCVGAVVGAGACVGIAVGTAAWVDWGDWTGDCLGPATGGADGVGPVVGAGGAEQDTIRIPAMSVMSHDIR